MNPEDRKLLEMARDALQRADSLIRYVAFVLNDETPEKGSTADKIQKALAALNARLAQEENPAPVARPLSEYHEELGPVCWWKFPVEEPAWIGDPLCDDWPGYHTHFTPHPPIPVDGPPSRTQADEKEESPASRIPAGWTINEDAGYVRVAGPNIATILSPEEKYETNAARALLYELASALLIVDGLPSRQPEEG